MMEGYLKKTICSWWRKASSSTRLLWFITPVILVSVLVACGGSRVFPKWVFAVNNSENYSWSWSPNGVNNISDSSMKDSSAAAADDIAATSQSLELKFAALPSTDDDYINLGPLASAPFPVEDAKEPVLDQEQSANISGNGSDIFLNFNETEPLSTQSRRKITFSRLERIEARLGLARAAIREARNRNQSHDPDYVPLGPIYLNANAFHRSYLEMEKQFKVYVYEEGEAPIFHNGPCKSTYTMEGNFIYHMEMSPFRTREPEKAHVFFLPMSVSMMVRFVFERDPAPNHNQWEPMRKVVRDYINLVGGKYPYWNRSLGADHFMLACHDWGPELSKSVPDLFTNSIRALCNANTSEGFKPFKDVSFPEILLPRGTMDGLLGGPSPSKRPVLAFFAGGLHGPIRPILLEHWENKDEDIKVYKYLPKGVSYYSMLRKSRYCLCPSGYEVASPRMVEALYTGCVPVLIKDNYVAPFSDVLNWKSFSVQVSREEIPNLKNILTRISTRQYIRLQRRGKQVRRHFEVNLPPKRYDVFHMILHSIWLRRLNTRLHGIEDS